MATQALPKRTYMFSSTRYARRITKEEIAAGDIITHVRCKGNEPPIHGVFTGHVFFFDKWATSDTFWAYESTETLDQTKGCKEKPQPCLNHHVIKKWSEVGMNWGKDSCISGT
jgi:hypothetical protein